MWFVRLVVHTFAASRSVGKEKNKRIKDKEKKTHENDSQREKKTSSLVLFTFFFIHAFSFYCLHFHLSLGCFSLSLCWVLPCFYLFRLYVSSLVFFFYILSFVLLLGFHFYRFLFACRSLILDSSFYLFSLFPFPSALFFTNPAFAACIFLFYFHSGCSYSCSFFLD